MSAPIVTQPGLVQIKAMYDPNPDTAEHPMNLLWFVQRAPVTLTQPNLTTIANEFDTVWSLVWKQVGVTSKHYVGCVATDYSTAFGLTWDTRGTFTPVAGLQATALPPQVAVLLSLHVAERWRGGHPRVYLPWIGQGAMDNTDPNKINTTAQGNVVTYFGGVEPGMNGIAVGGGLSQRVYRQRTTPGSAHLMPISTFTVQIQLATQRRRLRKAPHH